MTAIESVVEKLSPRKLRVSPRFHAILGFLLGHPEWTSPSLLTLSVTSDGFLIGRPQDPPDPDDAKTPRELVAAVLAGARDLPHEEMMGSAGDLLANLKGVAGAVDLTPDERKALGGAALAKLEDHGLWHQPLRAGLAAL